MLVTIEEMQQLYPLNVLAQLTNDTDGRTVDDSVLEVLLTEASDIVESYLRFRYDLPLPTIPMGVKRAVANIAYYHAHRRRSDTPPQGVVEEHTRTLDYLMKVQTGAVMLSDVTAPAFIRTNKTGNEKVMATLTGRMP